MRGVIDRWRLGECAEEFKGRFTSTGNPLADSTTGLWRVRADGPAEAHASHYTVSAAGFTYVSFVSCVFDAWHMSSPRSKVRTLLICMVGRQLTATSSSTRACVKTKSTGKNVVAESLRRQHTAILTEFGIDSQREDLL